MKTYSSKMRGVLLLVLVCVSLFSACAEKTPQQTHLTHPTQTQEATPTLPPYDSLKVMDMDELHFEEPGPCTPIYPGPYVEHVVIVTGVPGDETHSQVVDIFTIWLVDQAFDQHFRHGVTEGTCFLFDHIHYDIAIL